jgi:hypothetical protein
MYVIRNAIDRQLHEYGRAALEHPGLGLIYRQSRIRTNCNMGSQIAKICCIAATQVCHASNYLISDERPRAFRYAAKLFSPIR